MYDNPQLCNICLASTMNLDLTKNYKRTTVEEWGRENMGSSTEWNRNREKSNHQKKQNLSLLRKTTSGEVGRDGAQTTVLSLLVLFDYLNQMHVLLCYNILLFNKMSN